MSCAAVSVNKELWCELEFLFWSLALFVLRHAPSCFHTQMTAVVIQLLTEHVPAPLLWGFASAASCCGGLCFGLRLVNPMAFEILMAEEDDEDAQNNAIGQPTLNMFAQSVFISVPLNGCVSFYGFDSNISLGCCGLTFVVVGLLTAWLTFHDVHKAGQEIAIERRKKQTQAKAD